MIEEEERLVLANRTADGVAKLVADVRILWPSICAVEPVARAPESIPAAELVRIAMKGIGAALSHHINDRAGVAAVLGIKIVSDDTKFLSGIRTGAEHATDDPRHRGVVVIHAIE